MAQLSKQAAGWSVVDTAVAAIREDLSVLTQMNVPAVRRVRRLWSKELRHQGGSFVRAVAWSLVREGRWEERLVAYELLMNHGEAFAGLNESWIRRLGVGLDNWGNVDMFGVTVAGSAWRRRLIPDKVVLGWARSSDRWRKRLALVCTVALNSRARGGSGDPKRTLRVCRLLLEDRDDMVVKAMSWALRELSMREPIIVREFLTDSGEGLARRARREVLTKLDTGGKTPQRG